MMNNNDRLQDYNKDMNGIIRFGLLFGSFGNILLIISIGFHLFRPNPCGIIADSSSNLGSDAVANLVHSYVFSIGVPYLAALLAQGLKTTLSFTSLHMIVVSAWMLLSQAILSISYVIFYRATVDTFNLILGPVSCATDSKSFGFTLMLGIMFRLIFILFIIRHFSVPR